jgi:hypothetical protein
MAIATYCFAWLRFLGCFRRRMQGAADPEGAADTSEGGSDLAIVIARIDAIMR